MKIWIGIWGYRWVVRPILFRFDAETASVIALCLLEWYSRFLIRFRPGDPHEYRPRKCSCLGCGVIAPTWDLLLRHERFVHYPHMPYQKGDD